MLKITDPNFTDVMTLYGLDVWYYHAKLCSCVGENNGVPDSSDNCEMGYRYNPREQIRLTRTGTDKKTLNMPAGQIPDGAIVLSLPKYWKKKLQNAWITAAHGDVFSLIGKSQISTDILRYGVRDKVFAFDIQEILSVTVKNTTFIQGTDYILQDRTITWTEDGNKPDDGAAYCVEFLCNRQYIIYDKDAFDRGGEGDDLPRKINAVIRQYVNPDSNPIDAVDTKEYL